MSIYFAYGDPEVIFSSSLEPFALICGNYKEYRYKKPGFADCREEKKIIEINPRMHNTNSPWDIAASLYYLREAYKDAEDNGFVMVCVTLFDIFRSDIKPGKIIQEVYRYSDEYLADKKSELDIYLFVDYERLSYLSNRFFGDIQRHPYMDDFSNWVHWNSKYALPPGIIGFVQATDVGVKKMQKHKALYDPHIGEVGIFLEEKLQEKIKDGTYISRKDFYERSGVSEATFRRLRNDITIKPTRAKLKNLMKSLFLNEEEEATLYKYLGWAQGEYTFPETFSNMQRKYGLSASKIEDTSFLDHKSFIKIKNGDEKVGREALLRISLAMGLNGPDAETLWRSAGYSFENVDIANSIMYCALQEYGKENWEKRCKHYKDVLADWVETSSDLYTWKNKK